MIISHLGGAVGGGERARPPILVHCAASQHHRAGGPRPCQGSLARTRRQHHDHAALAAHVPA
eukprot:698105-Prorocentrum_minimum.AAC.1